MSQETQEKTGNEGKARTRKYTRRSAGERVGAKFDETLNIAQHVELTDEDREALARIEAIKQRAMAQADAGKIKASTVSVHPILAGLLDEQKQLRKEVRMASLRDRRLVLAQIEADCFAMNGPYRDEMEPWLESAIETVKSQIEAGEEVLIPERPEVNRINVKQLIDKEVAEFEASQNESENEPSEDVTD